MLILILIAIITAVFIIISVMSRKHRPGEGAQRIVEPLSKFVNISPLLGLAIFAVLFAIVLKGRLHSRYAAVGGAGDPFDPFGQVCKPNILPDRLGLDIYRLRSVSCLSYYRTT